MFTRPLGFKKGILFSLSFVRTWNELRISGSRLLFVTENPLVCAFPPFAVLTLEEEAEAFVRTRSAQDFGMVFAGGDCSVLDASSRTGSAGIAVGDCGLTAVSDPEIDSTMLLGCFLVDFEREGIFGTTGTIGRTLLGCLGVTLPFDAFVCTKDEGAVDGIDSVSDGA